MAEQDDDLSIRQLFRVIFMQGGQVAVGTAIGAGVLLLVGIVAVALSPIWLPIVAIWYWRRERRNAAAGGRDVTDLASARAVDAAAPPVPDRAEPFERRVDSVA